MVLDVFQGSVESGTQIVQWGWHGGDNQRFAVERVGNGLFSIRAKHSGKVLDVTQASNSDGTRIIQWDWHGGDNQIWSFPSIIDNPDE
jgi:Ricin-type beta-trefoil lectin domain-like